MKENVVEIALLDSGIDASHWTGTEKYKRVKSGIICIR